MQNSKYVVPQLQPERLGGQAGVYQLTADSVSPTRIVGRDSLGMPIEETVPIPDWREFVTSSGCVNKVTLRTSPIFSKDPDAVLYETHTLRDLIGAGWLPLNECPYTFEYKHYTGGALVEVPHGETACEGAERGCKHLQKVMAERKALAKAKFDADEANFARMKPDDVARMAEAFGDALSRHNAGTEMAAARSSSRKGRVDEQAER